MKRIVIAVLLSLFGPGLGQMYNREYKKGMALLIGSSALLLLPVFWLVKKMIPYLPDPKQGPISPETLQQIAIRVIGEDRYIYNIITFVFLGVWAYSITQAYFKANEIKEQEKE